MKKLWTSVGVALLFGAGVVINDAGTQHATAGQGVSPAPIIDDSELVSIGPVQLIDNLYLADAIVSCNPETASGEANLQASFVVPEILAFHLTPIHHAGNITINLAPAPWDIVGESGVAVFGSVYWTGGNFPWDCPSPGELLGVVNWELAFSDDRVVLNLVAGP